VAEQYREKAIGVILSGSGRDGSSGVREIHAAGGLTFVQEPAEAKIDGMPRAAIMTGVVGKVLPAKDISAELVRLSHDAFFLQPVADNQPEWEGLSPTAVDEQSVLRSIFTVLLQVTGVDFGQYKLPTIRRRIRRRMALHRLSDLGEYLAVLQKNPAEAEDLHDDILIHVTEFFLEPEAFSVLADVALPALLAERPPSVPIRAWVPACSSGEEGYSLAVTLLQYLEMRGEARPIQVFATDVSERMIDRARAGVYPNTIESQVSSEQLRRFFVKVDSGYRVASSVRECCVFARQDATRDPPFSKMDIVLCRNLLIYLGVGVQRKLVSVFHYALNPNGFLVLGRSETIGTYPDLFPPVDNRARIYRRKPGASTFRGAIDFPGRETAPAPPVSVPQADHPASGATNERSEMPADVKQILIDRFAPPSMILDQDFRSLRFHGDVSPYLALPVGEVVFDAVRMARPRLSTALAAILHDARRRGTAARKKGVPLQSGGKRRDIDLEAIPVGRPESRQYLVVFRDANRPGNGNRSGEKDLARVDQTRSRVRGVRAVAELEEELADTKEQMSAIVQDLGAANEELQSANEEILSSNEELQSTNEELDTAREELQSTNEELSTLNDELQTRNSELSRANGDLLNVIANTQIAVVIVSHSGTIRHVTPAAARVLNVMASDVGRPIGHIKPAVRDADLDQMIKEVSASASVVERQVEDGERNTYILRGCPYKDVDNRINGVVLALFDVSSALETSRRIGEAIIARVNDPILLLDSDRRVRRANRAFCEMFHVSPTETE